MRVHTSKSGSYVKQANFRSLEGIKDEFHPISERSNAAGYRENDTDVQAVCELAENIRDVILEYQVRFEPSSCPKDAPLNHCPARSPESGVRAELQNDRESLVALV